MHTAVSSTKKVINESNHSAKNISDSLSEVLNERGVFDKINAIVMDNAKNMVKAC